MANLDQDLELITQSTGQNFDLTRGESRLRFTQAVKTDIASIAFQLNNIYFPLVDRLVYSNTVNPLETGLDGRAIYTNADAVLASGNLFFDPSLQTPRSLKESFDVLLAEIVAIRNSSAVNLGPTVFDDAALQSDILVNAQNILQLKLDTVGPTYVLTSDGVAAMTYPLSQYLDAFGAFFTGYPSTNNAPYTNAFPTLALAVALSQILIDTTLAQSVITDLPAHLAAIRTFVGMDTTTATPLYSAHGAISYVSDTDSLELAIQTLDEALAIVDAEPKSFVFKPGGIARGNVYNSWPTLYAALTAWTAVGQAQIVFDDTASPGAQFVIPSGSWNMTNTRWTRGVVNTPDPTFLTSYGTLKEITFANGAAITNLYDVEGLILRLPVAVTTPITYSSASSKNIRFIECGLYSNAGANPLITVTGAGTHHFFFKNSTEIGNGVDPVINVAVGLTVRAYVTNNSSLTAEVFTGAGNLGASFRNIDSPFSVTHTGLLGTIGTITIYDEAFVGANGVDNGIKGLVPTPLAAQNTAFLRGDATWAAVPGGAPLASQYVVVAVDGTLTDERALAVTGTDLTLTDGGAGGTITLAHATTAVTPGSYTLANITVDSKGRITAAATGSGVTSPFDTVANVTSNSPGTLSTDSFVFGSDGLDDVDPARDTRFLFEKSSGAFRAGTVNSTQWDTRGDGSVAFGLNTTAEANYTFTSGATNTIDSTSTHSSVLGGSNNSIVACVASAIVAGSSNTVNATSNVGIYSAVSSGIGAGAGSQYAAILGGQLNTIGNVNAATWSSILGGSSNSVNATKAAIVNGESNSISNGSLHSILGGSTNAISGVASTRHSIVGGINHALSSTGSDCAIIGGHSGSIGGAVNSSIILGGGASLNGNTISSNYSVIAGGLDHTINAGQQSFISGGSSCTVDSLARCSIVGSDNAVIDGATTGVKASGTAIVASSGGSVSSAFAVANNSLIAGGITNSIDGAAQSLVLGGSSNTINLGTGSSQLLGSTVLGGTGNTVETRGSYGVAMGRRAVSYMTGQVAVGSGDFPSAVGGLTGQAQFSDIGVLGEYSNLGGGLTVLTTDGSGTVTSANCLFIPQHTSVFAIAEWVAHGSNGVVAGGRAGSTSVLISRLTGLAVIEQLGGPEYTTSVGAAGRISYPGTTVNYGSFALGGVGNGSIVFKLDSLGLAVNARCFARIRWTQVRYDGT